MSSTEPQGPGVRGPSPPPRGPGQTRAGQGREAGLTLGPPRPGSRSPGSRKEVAALLTVTLSLQGQALVLGSEGSQGAGSPAASSLRFDNPQSSQEA